MRGLILFSIAALAACGPMPEAADEASEQVEGAVVAAPETNDQGISAAEFSAIQTGMSEDEVAEIVGSAGEVISENEMAGIRTVMVQWPGESGLGANANAMFQDGKLVQKSQFGLE